MATKVVKCGIKKEAGYLYFIDKDGDVSKAKMARGGKKKKAAKKTAKKKTAKKKTAKKAAKKKKR
jgi:hypothetical protein